LYAAKLIVSVSRQGASSFMLVKAIFPSLPAKHSGHGIALE
jgi:hypothetical protein